jgi:hypothetical protein
MFILLATISCHGESGRDQSAPAREIGRVRLYTFASDRQYFLKDAQPYELPAETSLREALMSLGRHLSKTYFHKTYTGQVTHIRFEVVRIEKISTKSRPLTIAVINMIDKNGYAMTHFFQGSTGGQTTFCMLGATFMQPHLEPPLTDGLMLLYNGEPLSELDHINLSGILTPRLFRFVTKRAIYGTKIKNAHWSQKRA